MGYEYTYIIAPHTANNFAVLQIAVSLYPELQAEQRIKIIYKKDEADIVSDGVLLANGNPLPYLLLKATTADINEQLLAHVQDYELYYIDNLPFQTYWL